MPFEYAVAVKVFPDMKSLKQTAKAVQESVGNVAVEAQAFAVKTTGGGKGIGAGAIVGLLGTIGKYLVPISAAALLLQNKFSGLGEYVKIIVDILMLFLKPIADLLMILLRPLILLLLKLAIWWIQFWKDPIGNLKKAFEGLGGAVRGAVGTAGKVITDVKDKAVETANSILTQIKDAFAQMPFGQIAVEGIEKWQAGISKIGEGLSKVKDGFIQILQGDFLGGLRTIFSGALTTLQGMTTALYGGLQAIFGMAISILTSAFMLLWKRLVALFQGAIAWLRNAWTSFIKKLIEVGNNAVKWVSDTVRGILGAIRRKAEEIINGARRAAERIVSSVKGVLGMKQHGGVIPRTGLYLMHEGEVVGRGTPTQNITLNINVNGTVDRDIVDELARRIMVELRRTSRW